MRLLRAPAAQGLLGLLVAGYLGLVLKSIRWTSENRAAAEGVWDAGGGVIVCFWHGRIALSPACWPLDRVRKGRAQEPRVLISLSPDGGFIAGAMARLGFPAIRGSSTKTWDKAKLKGGAAAFREVLRWLAAGGGVAVTPDGPRGPAGQMAEGAALLAARAGAPVLLVGLACRPCLRLKSWDETVLPLPFARGTIVWAGPFHAPNGAARGSVADLRLDWQARLDAATARAEAMLG